MKLIVAIVQAEDAGPLLDTFNRIGLRTTRINTVGGFLETPNVTLLIAVDDDRVDEVLHTIQQECHPRTRYINALPGQGELPGMAGGAITAPIEVLVGGATIFVLNLRRLVRVGAKEAIFVSPLPPAGTMQLILAVMPSDDADRVTTSLLEADYRVTRINTTSGFLRRGNATLLLGTEPERLNAAIAAIQSHCRYREEATPEKPGTPRCAAIFVLDVDRFEHV